MKKLFILLATFSLISVFAQPTINGDLSDSDYTEIATKQNSNSGFGTNIDVSKIVMYPDVTNNHLYFGVVGKLNTSSNDGIGIWLDLSQVSGVASNTALGGSPGTHYMNSSYNNFRADFEVDYMFSINPGSSSNCYVDVVRVAGTRASQYLGNCGLSGSSTSNTSSDFFSSGSVTFAFNNSGTSNRGFEIRIPFSQLGSGVTSSGNVRLFAFVVSNTSFFSNVTVPGNVSGGNLEFNPNFSSLSGGPYNSGDNPLPVELKSFTASVSKNSVTLNWVTSTELNNYGFEIERSQNQNIWEKIGFVNGRGNSNSPIFYFYSDNNLSSGKYFYRLKQLDNDGSFTYSNVIEVNVNLVPSEYSLSNYPNPFNPNTTIEFTLAKSGNYNIKVYNLNGEMVSELVNGYYEAGVHKVNFDASGLSSGMYIYTLQGEGINLKNKLQLLK